MLVRANRFDLVKIVRVTKSAYGNRYPIELRFVRRVANGSSYARGDRADAQALTAQFP